MASVDKVLAAAYSAPQQLADALVGAHGDTAQAAVGAALLMAVTLLLAAAIPRRQTSPTPIMVAFEIVAGLMCLLLSAEGIYGFFYTDTAPLDRDPLGGTTFIGHLLCLTMLGYQLWDLAICLVVPELRTFAMIGHHVCTAYLAFYGLTPFCQGFTIYSFGIVEISNIPLT